MVETNERKKLLSDGEFLRVRIDLPSFQLEVATRDPKMALPELRKILEAVNIDDELMYEEFVQEELHSTFSDTFTNNPQIMNVIKKLLKQEEDYRVATTQIPSTATIDIDEQTKRIHLQRRDVQQAVTKLTSNVDGHVVKHGIIHINGMVDQDGKFLIVDHIHKHMPTAQLRAFHSKGIDENITLECIFFGEFPDREEE